jgi:hypothetical protein
MHRRGLPPQVVSHFGIEYRAQSASLLTRCSRCNGVVAVRHVVAQRHGPTDRGRR